MFRSFLRPSLALLALPLVACTAGATTEILAQLSDSLVVAKAAEGAYAVQPGADQVVVERLAGLTTAAQAAVAAYGASGAGADQAAAQAALAALTTYLSTQAATRALAARAPGAPA